VLERHFEALETLYLPTGHQSKFETGAKVDQVLRIGDPAHAPRPISSLTAAVSRHDIASVA
jgi:hypothetical protein